MRYFILLILILSSGYSKAQETDSLVWYDLGKMKIFGQPGGEVSNPFQRFPDTMQELVREKVWELSKNPAGLNLNFKTNASRIVVSYEVSGDQGFPHMPPTGVSGVDLYMKEKAEEWKWVRGQFNFSDTITYKFQINTGSRESLIKDYMLYLPLYATVKWMKIGINKGSQLEVDLPDENELPIIAYGTSITQGACAGRPGTAWTARLSRMIHTPVLNFGFSGNGRLEKEVVQYIGRLKAKAFILDCLANFSSGQGLDAEEAEKRLIESIGLLRKSQPETPIIITDHAGYAHGEVNLLVRKIYMDLNEINQKVYDHLTQEGVPGLYLLKKKDLNLGVDDYIDGVHPNDAGMEKYSEAYYKKLMEISDL
ncbi:SGNH/GDSL hydrolase family protein [Antarcticibacterium sp. 1MA-6-2]|uniref:SGNH/GDSL hydrolase family protein n=1 Tax=Antarcticibacterium sp. 1MA-6-2 TaxID=2908210 RepID=UPI001F47F24E|nr:SGNH/GDSL hydrolase family protein [Antarcticibacterium sp. 1MA-6-2]UJH92635.1 SGNH/GDSL hydrolase family protein [Antarcticibacterium sp. 1MA-6-2]